MVVVYLLLYNVLTGPPGRIRKKDYAMKKYIAKGTLQVCPYSGEPAIVISNSISVDKSQCEFSEECVVEHCPLEQELDNY